METEIKPVIITHIPNIGPAVAAVRHLHTWDALDFVVIAVDHGKDDSRAYSTHVAYRDSYGEVQARSGHYDMSFGEAFEDMLSRLGKERPPQQQRHLDALNDTGRLFAIERIASAQWAYEVTDGEGTFIGWTVE